MAGLGKFFFLLNILDSKFWKLKFSKQNLTGGPNGGLHVTDVTNASRTNLMNLTTLQWDPVSIKSQIVTPTWKSKHFQSKFITRIFSFVRLQMNNRLINPNQWEMIKRVYVYNWSTLRLSICRRYWKYFRLARMCCRKFFHRPMILGRLSMDQH